MKVGVNILNFGPGATPQKLLAWAQLSEKLGYHSIMISDHVAITPSVRPRYPEPFFDTFTTLAWLAGQTQRVSLGTTVCVLPYRHPILTAREVANIDNFSGGRFIFGVGVGNPEDEYAALGVPHAKRGRLADESLEAIRALWTGDGDVSYAGRLIKFENVSAIATRQTPHPPIWVGGTSDAAFRRTVRHGDGWHPILWTQKVATDGLAALEKFSALAGKPRPSFCPRIRLSIVDEAVDGDRPPGTGSFEQVRDDIGELQRMGAEHVCLDWFTGDLEATRNHEHGWEMLQRLAEDVLDLEKETLR